MAKTMITSADIQVKYEQLYEFLMDFLWEFQVVQSLANLEIAIFKRFPDKDEMLKYLRELNRSISYTYNDLADDDKTEFKEAYEDLEEAIERFDGETAGCELYSVEEVIDSPDDVVDASDDMLAPTVEGEKRKFKIGGIKKTTGEEVDLQEEAIAELEKTLQNPFEE